MKDKEVSIRELTPNELKEKDINNGMAFEVFGGNGDDGDEIVEKLRESLTSTGVIKNSNQIVQDIANSFGDEIVEPPLPIYSLAHLLISNTWHSKCIYKLRDVATRQGWYITSQEKDADTTKVEEFVKETMRVGEDSSSPSCPEDLLGNLLVDYRAFGNAYIEVVRDLSGRPIEFYHIPALTVRKARQGKRFPNGGFFQMSGLMNRNSYADWYGTARTNTKYSSQKYSLFGGGIYHKVFFKNYGDSNVYDVEGDIRSGIDIEEQANEIIHLKDYHPLSPLYGIPSYISSYDAMLGDEAAEKWNLSFFTNNRIPRWLIVITGKNFSDQEKSQFQNYFLNILKGRPHLPTILSSSNVETKVTIHKLESDVNEASFLEMRKASRDEIIASHDTPPRMVGIISTGVMGGKGDSQKQREDYKNFTVLPCQKKVTSWFNDIILPDSELADFSLELKSFDVEDSEEKEKKSSSIEKLMSNGVISVNEARKILNMKPLDDEFADKHYVIYNENIYSLTDGEIVYNRNMTQNEEQLEEQKDDEDKMTKSVENLKDVLSGLANKKS